MMARARTRVQLGPQEEAIMAERRRMAVRGRKIRRILERAGFVPVSAYGGTVSQGFSVKDSPMGHVLIGYVPNLDTQSKEEAQRAADVFVTRAKDLLEELHLRVERREHDIMDLPYLVVTGLDSIE